MKKIISVLCVLTIMVSAAGCSPKTDAVETMQNDYRNSTLTGKVTAIDDMIVTLQLGELSEKKRGVPKGEEAPAEGDIPQMPPAADSKDEIKQPTGNTEGEIASAEMTSDETAEISAAQATEQENGMKAPLGMSRFVAGEETAVVDLTTATIMIENIDKITDGSINDITVDDILVVSFGEENTGISVTIKYIPQFKPTGEMDGTPPEIPSDEMRTDRMDNMPPEMPTEEMSDAEE